ncbi:DNA polymerase III subunit gamma/tau [Microbacterium sp. P07]|uniref:DNA polymerase III subunit gamma/tau n=1 Tax=Microbacterium sp. P07 TaxID=3366952 RepID=UPI003745683F
MTARRDDDALSWDGDDDPTLDVGADLPRAPVEERVADAAPPAPPVTREPAVAPDEEERAGLGNVALVSLGLIAGAYLFFAIGWFIAGLRLQALGGLPVASVMLTLATFAAAAAPLVWFATAFALTRRSATWVRFAWLVAGIVLLVPWPFIFTGAI